MTSEKYNVEKGILKLAMLGSLNRHMHVDPTQVGAHRKGGTHPMHVSTWAPRAR